MFFMFVLGMVLFGTTVSDPAVSAVADGLFGAAGGRGVGGRRLRDDADDADIAGALVSRMDPRLMMAFGFCVTATALYYMTTHMTLAMDFRTAAMLRSVPGRGAGVHFHSVQHAVLRGVPREKNNQISSMISFIRNIGGSIGIALISTLITRGTQRRNDLPFGNMNNGNPRFRQMLDGVGGDASHAGNKPCGGDKSKPRANGWRVQQQATALAYTAWFPGW